ncbi:hypothetical protein JK358_37740 [Nocardia sp. 2]|uniref:Uncharacterized protein n=1 Tax=Nocardia acididurans TaxID=2802282 RepID=A0ABS1MLE0_9NOCA|nr:hypothetical protein [Nocardia acididurans]MBL1080153.1 hypothetical protein [Nocardia acididurans]
MADPLDELRVLKTQLRELRWTTQVDSLEVIARESAKGPGARGGVSKATIGNITNPDNSTMPRWETFEIFIDTCLRLIERAGAEPPSDGGDRRVWRQRYLQIRDALGDSGDNDESATPVATEPNPAAEGGDPAQRPGRPTHRRVWLTAAAALVIVVAVVLWQVTRDESGSGAPQPESGSSFCSNRGGRVVFEDTFTDVSSGWPHRSGQAEYASGAYRLTAVSGTHVYGARAPVPALPSSCVEALVRMESGLGGIGLWCRGESADTDPRYSLGVDSSGLWGISIEQPVDPRLVVLAAQDELPGRNIEDKKLLDERIWIGGSCRDQPEGVELIVSVDGHHLRYFDMVPRLPVGNVGVLAWSWLVDPGASSTFLIEEIRVWELPTTPF